jgi:FkbM family methyltransferase
VTIASRLVGWVREIGAVGRFDRRAEISTSYFGEDILVSRLLKPSCSGIYVDVGAHHPITGSNTYKLYRRGWRGLAIDPNPRFVRHFRRYRPKDTHIVAGVALARGSMTYHAFDPDVFNTLCPEQARKIEALGKRKIDEIPVPCLPLSDLVAEHLRGRHIDILNIDCEGMDLDALRSLDLAVNRPTAMVVEDYPRFMAFRDGREPTGMDLFLRGQGYSPIAQSAWSAIFVANDWRDLIGRSAAFDAATFPRAYLPS